LRGNYGYLGVEFADGSVGSFDSAWGPMVGAAPASVITASGPAGSVSIVSEPHSSDDENACKRALVYEPTMTNESDARNSEIIQLEKTADAGGEDAFVLQQQYLYDCINDDVCMDEHFDDVLTSMSIVAAGDESIESGTIVRL